MGRAGASAFCAVPDDCFDGEHNRLVLRLSPSQSGLDIGWIMAIYAFCSPVRGFETCALICIIGHICAAINGDSIIVEQDDKVRQFHMACQCYGFLADAFHQAPVAS